MRRESTRLARRAALGLTLVLSAWSLAASTAKAQTPVPRIPEITERSGLIQRFRLPKTTLPTDPYRDNFYGSRFGDFRQTDDTNNPLNGGLYGVRLPAKDTASIYPFFYGAPGQSTITAESRPWRPSYLRAVQQLVHHRKPVGMYYERGSYVPIYDLDSFAPGPGPDYFPFFYQGWHGG